MVDNEIAHLAKADNTLDVMCIHGSGASISVLMDADVRGHIQPQQHHHDGGDRAV